MKTVWLTQCWVLLGRVYWEVLGFFFFISWSNLLKKEEEEKEKDELFVKLPTADFTTYFFYSLIFFY